jgi:beta-ureidopropionase
MVEPYTAVGLIPSFWGIRRREDIDKNLEHLESLTKAAYWLSNLDIPVRLIAIPEGALQGFNDEVLDLDHAEFARACAIDIPGPKTDRLGRLARQWACSSWHRPRRATRIGPTASSMSGLSSTRTAPWS